MSYDRAITVFSPDGHLLQVEYSMEAVRRGSTVVGIQAQDCVVLAVEKRALAKLQDARTIRKILSLDDTTVLAFAGLNADARVLIQHLRLQGQSYRLTMEDAPSTDWMARQLASTQQQYTQQAGVRPFGIATLVAGFDAAGQPVLYQTDPAGTHSRWKAQTIGGRNAKSLREYLEKQYSTICNNNASNMTEAAAVRLAVAALLEVVDSGAKTMEMCVVRRDTGKEMLTEDAIQAVVSQIEAEQLQQQQPPPPPPPSAAGGEGAIPPTVMVGGGAE